MNSTPSKSVFILIPVHNRRDLTLRCLDNLDQIDAISKYQVVVIDDGSTDGTKESIQAQYKNRIIILPGSGNLWWTGAIALGMQYAYEHNAKYFIWLNDDCLIAEQSIPDILDFLKQNNQHIIGGQGYPCFNTEDIVFGGKYRKPTGYYLNKFSNERIVQCDMLSGNLVCISRDVVNTIGFPNSNLLPHYGGDSLYLIRARKAGFKIFLDPRNINYDAGERPPLVPDKWLIRDGEPLEILNMVFKNESAYSWRVWLYLDWEDYKYIGIPIFLYKYVFSIFIPIAMITILRFLPIQTRILISDSKRKIKSIPSIFLSK